MCVFLLIGCSTGQQHTGMRCVRVQDGGKVVFSVDSAPFGLACNCGHQNFYKTGMIVCPISGGLLQLVGLALGGPHDAYALVLHGRRRGPAMAMSVETGDRPEDMYLAKCRRAYYCRTRA